ncbi:hypothetical protein IGS73_16200 [Janibacter indicus]|uniref:Uncharacterized protein n=1 Tax=Janibacter indicus TaxID=857417 RepID=A0A7L9IYY3_9MICO|nr:hypothetical protein [Janibacter indicus]QOK22581.1 hypothetical protein IGS73_16200 [Janibacter indicus]
MRSDPSYGAGCRRRRTSRPAASSPTPPMPASTPDRGGAYGDRVHLAQPEAAVGVHGIRWEFAG